MKKAAFSYGNISISIPIEITNDLEIAKTVISGIIDEEIFKRNTAPIGILKVNGIGEK